jgi:UDP-glucose 4-epimerase
LLDLHGLSRVLVTGGAGFIGSHLVDRLLREDLEVTAFDDLSTGKQSNIEHNLNNKNYAFLKGDIRDRESVNKALDGVEAIFHEAALVSVDSSLKNPLVTNDVNVNGTLNVLQACVDSDVKSLVFASSSSVYGNSEMLPNREDISLNPISPYAVSKLAAESYVRVFCQVYGLQTICLRYFNVYGPRQTSGPYSGVISIFTESLLNNRHITVFGDGEQTRDFINVRDVVEANICALVSDRAVGEVFNVASGHATTINELVKNLQKITNTVGSKVIYAEPRQGDIKHSYADISKAEKLLNYKPKVKLFDGLAELVEYWKKIKYT